MAIRVPNRPRENRSRPRWSVPSQCWPRRRHARGDVDLVGHMRGDQRRRQPAEHDDQRGDQPEAAARASPDAAEHVEHQAPPPAARGRILADARIEPGIGQVDQQIGDDEDGDDHQDAALHDRIVAVADGRVGRGHDVFLDGLPVFQLTELGGGFMQRAGNEHREPSHELELHRFPNEILRRFLPRAFDGGVWCLGARLDESTLYPCGSRTRSHHYQ